MVDKLFFSADNPTPLPQALFGGGAGGGGGSGGGSGSGGKSTPLPPALFGGGGGGGGGSGGGSGEKVDAAAAAAAAAAASDADSGNGTLASKEAAAVEEVAAAAVEEVAAAPGARQILAPLLLDGLLDANGGTNDTAAAAEAAAAAAAEAETAAAEAAAVAEEAVEAAAADARDGWTDAGSSTSQEVSAFGGLLGNTITKKTAPEVSAAVASDDASSGDNGRDASVNYTAKAEATDAAAADAAAADAAAAADDDVIVVEAGPGMAGRLRDLGKSFAGTVMSAAATAALRFSEVGLQVRMPCLVWWPYCHTLCLVTWPLGWRFRIRTDSLEGRIRADSGGFRVALQRLRGILAVLYSLYGHFDPTKLGQK